MITSAVFSGAAFNANNVSGYLPFGVFPGPITSWPNALYDPLDRPYALTSWYTNGGIQYDTIAYTYDGVDNVLSEAETPGTYNFYTNTPGPTSPTLNFTYDENGRRTQLTSTLNGYSMPTINYGYDCADELVSMSNDGSQLPSCGPSTNVSYTGNTSTQTAYNYDMDGGLANTIANGIQTVFSLDVDERPILQTFQTVGGGCPGSPPSCFGTLSYGYDLDGRVTDEGGTLASINPPANETATYSVLDQLATWNGYPVSYETVGTSKTAENIQSDPTTNLNYTWNARTQLTTLAGGSWRLANVFDPLGRRESLTSSAYSFQQYFLHDGGALIGYQASTQNVNFLTPPGRGAAALALYASPAPAVVYVPLYDISGSTIELVNVTNGNTPTTSYYYDPGGEVTTSNNNQRTPWPFMYHGLEQEYPDTWKLYWEPGGNVYNPDPLALAQWPARPGRWRLFPARFWRRR